MSSSLGYSEFNNNEKIENKYFQQIEEKHTKIDQKESNKRKYGNFLNLAKMLEMMVMTMVLV